MFPFEFCINFKNSVLYRTPPVLASDVLKEKNLLIENLNKKRIQYVVLRCFVILFEGLKIIVRTLEIFENVPTEKILRTSNIAEYWQHNWCAFTFCYIF